MNVNQNRSYSNKIAEYEEDSLLKRNDSSQQTAQLFQNIGKYKIYQFNSAVCTACTFQHLSILMLEYI